MDLNLLLVDGGMIMIIRMMSKVSVYEYNGDTWNQLGNDIYGEIIEIV